MKSASLIYNLEQSSYTLHNKFKNPDRLLSTMPQNAVQLGIWI